MRLRCDSRSIGPLFLYLALSFLFFGRGLVGHLSDRYIGIGTDPGLFIFFLEWWKYVFAYHVNPFITHLQWAPTGANLAWATFIPLFGIAALPLTATLGPIATFNLLIILCPALTAWTACLLCRYLCSSIWPAVLGGYVFGFSPFMLAHLLGHLTVLMMFPVPLMVLVTLRRLNDEISVRIFTIAFTLLIVTLFLCWPEAVATATLFGGVAIALAWMLAPQWRQRLQALVLPTSFAYLASVIILSAYIYYFFALGQPTFPGRFGAFTSVHPSNFLIPTTANLFGTFALARRLCGGSHIYETGAYMALPLLLITANFARTHWRLWATRFLVSLLAAICIASLGPTLHLWGAHSLPMPWLLFCYLPLIDKALPARFSVYVFLIFGIILCRWLTDESVQKSTRVVGACAMVLFTLPNLDASYWTTPIDMPAFFADRLYTRYVHPNENLLILPYGIKGNSDIWQASSDFYFRMAGGYVGPPYIPAAFEPYLPIVNNFYNQTDFPLSGEMLKVFLVQKQVNAVIVVNDGRHLWSMSANPGPLFPVRVNFDQEQKKAIQTLFANLGVVPIQVGGVSLYHVPLDRLAVYKSVNPLELGKRIAQAQLDTLIIAAEEFLSTGGQLSGLSLDELQRLGLLPPHWVRYGPGGHPQNSLVVTGNNADVIVGVVASSAAIQALADHYRPYATRLEIAPLAPIAVFAESIGRILLVEYSPTQLASAAAMPKR